MRSAGRFENTSYNPTCTSLVLISLAYISRLVGFDLQLPNATVRNIGSQSPQYTLHLVLGSELQTRHSDFTIQTPFPPLILRQVPSSGLHNISAHLLALGPFVYSHPDHTIYSANWTCRLVFAMLTIHRDVVDNFEATPPRRCLMRLPFPLFHSYHGISGPPRTTIDDSPDH